LSRLSGFPCSSTRSRLSRMRASAPPAPEQGNRRLRRRDRPLCGAKTRAGGTCLVIVEFGKARCRFHGRLSTGPKTDAGRARIAEAQRRRRRLYRAGYAMTVGLAFYVGDELKHMMISSGWDPSVSQGTDNWMLPIPATFIVGTDGIVRAPCLPRYGRRLSSCFSSRFRDRAGLTTRLRPEPRCRRG
jgi:hypothetical protein